MAVADVEPQRSPDSVRGLRAIAPASAVFRGLFVGGSHMGFCLLSVALLSVVPYIK